MAGCISRRRRRSRILAGFLVAAAVSLAGAPKAPTSKVSAVRFWSLGETTRIAIEVSDGFKFHSERLTNPDRLFFDIQGASPGMVAKGLQKIAVGDGILKQIRVGETQPGVTRVVLDLEQKVEFTASQLTSPDRLMIELRGKDRPAPVVGKVTEVAAPVPVAPPGVKHPIVLEEGFAAPAAAAKKSEPRRFEPPPHTEIARAETTASLPAELIPPPPMPVMAKATKVPAAGSLSSMKTDLPPPPGNAAATLPELKTEKPASGIASEPAKRNANGDRSLTRVLGLKLGRVVIDPGHGGKDIGTHGPSGLNEKEVVLDVSRRLGADQIGRASCRERV